MTASPVRVAVAIATYARPTMLAELLDSLARLEADPGAEVRVIVVDNDAGGSARAVVDRTALPFPLEYAVEPERNISLARNRAVRLALEWRADFVAFVDDDEAASPGWLRELLEMQRRSGAEVVMGAVRPRYDPGVPPWVVRGGFFEQPAAGPGAPLAVASTNNVLVSAGLLADLAGPFDPRFGISGGGDSLFFIRAGRGGARLVWAPGSVVSESIPASRARAGWILRRAFRVGNSAVWCERALEPPSRRLAGRVAKAAARLLLGAVLLSPSLLLGRRGAVRALWNVCYGAGALAALAGHRYHEYRLVHGR